MSANSSDERIIIVAPIGRDGRAMADYLTANGFRAQLCSTLLECAAEVQQGAGVLLLTEESLELAHVTDFFEMLKTQPTWSEIPLILLTKGGESRLVKLLDLAVSAAGGVTLLERPIGLQTLLRSVQVGLRSRLRQYQVRDLIQEQQRASRMKDEFLATVSHELRTPLNAILGWATILSRGAVDQDALERAIAAIERNARAQAQLIEDLLDVSRIISGKLHLDIQPIVIANVIKAAADAIRPAADAKQVQLIITAEAGVEELRADEARLQQIIWNLLSNSIKFTPAGGQTHVRVGRDSTGVEICVSDTGEGISREFLPFIFERFRQADASITRKHGGLGLGLAITRHLVEMHGGTIRAESEGEGRGATFRVHLPVTAAIPVTASSNGDQNSLSLNSTVAAHLPNLTGIRVLAVDDAEDARALLRFVLEHYGAQVTTAASARDALQVLADWRPDVIVCDIGMPEEDGYSFIKKVRKLETVCGGETPAVAVTGYVRVEDRMRALEAGYQMFVPKPVEAIELASLIASVAGATG